MYIYLYVTIHLLQYQLWRLDFSGNLSLLEVQLRTILQFHLHPRSSPFPRRQSAMLPNVPIGLFSVCRETVKDVETKAIKRSEEKMKLLCTWCCVWRLLWIRTWWGLQENSATQDSIPSDRRLKARSTHFFIILEQKLNQQQHFKFCLLRNHHGHLIYR